MKLEDIIDFHAFFMTLCIVIAYQYITKEESIYIIKK